MRHGAPPMCIHCGKPEARYHPSGYCESSDTRFEAEEKGPRPGDKFVEMPGKAGQWGEIVETVLDVYPSSDRGRWLVMWEFDSGGDDPRSEKRTTMVKRGGDGRWVRAD
jgi:hypothetical protein